MNRQRVKLIGASCKQCGFTLVELMVAMTIGLFMVATIGYVFVGAKQSFNSMDDLAYMQESARYAFEYMAKDIRMAGFTGSAPGLKDSNRQDLIGATTWDNLKDLYDNPLLGHQAGTTFPNGITPNSGTDGLTIVRADQDNELPLAESISPTPGTPLKVVCPSLGKSRPREGEIYVISDYTKSAIFSIAADADAECDEDTSLTVNFSSSQNLSTIPFNGGYQSTSIYPLSGAVYYIDDNANNKPALFRRELSVFEGNPSLTWTELVTGVKDMDILYGVDTSNPEDGNIDDYLSATGVNSLASPITSEERWKRVLAVRVTLVMESLVSTNTSGAPIEKIFTNTIAVRNRLK